MSRKPSKGKKGTAAERRVESFRLFKDGWSYREIGAQLGVSVKTAFEDVKETLEELKAERMKVGNSYVERELANLDRMEREVLPLTKNRTITVKKKDAYGNVIGEEEMEVGPSLDAIDRVLKIQKRRGELTGHDAPKKLEHDVGPTLEELVAGSRDAEKESEK